MARLIKVRIKTLKNSRTHSFAPAPWNENDVYYAEQEDSTHYRLTTFYDYGGQSRGKQIYLTWPAEDLDIIDTNPEKEVPVELVSAGVVGPRRISSKGPNQQQIAKVKIASTGDSTDYYTIPEWATELRHLIQHKNMNFDVGNIFKAAYRLGEKAGVDHEYDLIKIIFFAQSELERVRREKNG